MFLRLFLLTTLFFFNLQACKNGYFSCVAKTKDSHSIQNDSLSIPVTKNKRLVYSKNTPKAKILKYDPFLSLYLVQDKHPFPYPFDLNMRLQLGMAAVTDKVFVEGKVLQEQVGLNQLAKYSAKIKTPALVTSSCCSLEGILTDKGMIDKYFLHHFIYAKSAEYGDIGIRVKQDGKCVKVVASNPYWEDNPFKRGDCVVAFDGKKVRKASVLMRRILFSKVGSKHKITIIRGTKRLVLYATTRKRIGGGEVSDTFLEHRGIYFNKKLQVVRLSQYFQKYGLLLGDRLIQVNGVRVKNQDELREYIENFKDFSSLLFERRNFQFFVNIK
ncbi:MAG: PDZ domain-containing protein [Epsilonproteobacteria bacterium]|nr:PDZ domain-containing protein [Campylobacterota bacterium]